LATTEGWDTGEAMATTEAQARTHARGSHGYLDGGGPTQRLERLQADRVALERNIEEMRKHVEEGTTPTTWPTQPLPYYGTGAYAPSPEQEKKILEEQMTAISSQMEAIKKRLEEIKVGD